LLRQAELDGEFASARASTIEQAQDMDRPVNRLDARLAEMDASDVAVSVLSLPPPATTFGDAATARSIAERSNDEFLAAADGSGGRLRALVSLPMPHVEESLGELRRVAGAAGLAGVQVLSTGVTAQAAPDRAEPVLALCAELNLTVVLHPATEALPDTYDDWMLWATIGPVVSSSVAAARLVFSGVLDRLPGLNIVVPHLGGVLPYLVQRMEDFGAWGAEQPLGHYLRNRLFFDTCSYHPPAMRCAVETAGADRLVLGTDYPIRGSLSRAVDDVQTFFADDPATAQAVLSTLAERLFPAR
jgi:aminocarboxymuconate-semialdehyde decarboxylase